MVWSNRYIVTHQSKEKKGIVGSTHSYQTDLQVFSSFQTNDVFLLWFIDSFDTLLEDVILPQLHPLIKIKDLSAQHILIFRLDEVDTRQVQIIFRR